MEEQRKKINSILLESVTVLQRILQSEAIMELILEIKDVMVGALEMDKKILFCGNGGSAADAQHLAAELAGRFYKDRPPLYAEALHVNTSYLTAVANDYSFDEVYSRLIQAKGKKGDILFCLSTSGNSKNILKAAEEAHAKGIIVVGMTGAKGGKLAPHCHFLIKIPSDDTPRIQEAHIVIGHILCELVEEEIFSE